MISVAETEEGVVQPMEDRAFTIVAESTDRSGMGRATLAPRLGMSAEVPPLRPRPTLGMDDMGMGGMSHGSMGGMSSGSMAGMDHGDGHGSGRWRRHEWHGHGLDGHGQHEHAR